MCIDPEEVKLVYVKDSGASKLSHPMPLRSLERRESAYIKSLEEV
jgi:hypothetical protein